MKAISVNTTPMSTDMNRLQAQQSYTDLNQLNSIRRLGSQDKSLALKEIAQQFEAMFMQMMLKSMRSANDVFAKDNPLNSFEANFHRDMLDNQLSLSLASSQQLSLADALYRQLHQSYTPDTTLSGVIQPLKDKNGLVNHQRFTNNNPYSKAVDSAVRIKQESTTLDNLETPQDFIDAITPYAKVTAERIGVDYKILVAQSALETGWGQYSIRDSSGNHSFNLFNIKADNRWQGDSINVATVEYKEGIAQKELANFRRYKTITDAFDDYENFVSGPRYQYALSVAGDSEAYITELQRAGYATDPHYAEKINQIVNDYLKN